MKKRTVTQYACEFCDKRGLSASAMTKHERHCTKNPNRVCRVCKMLEHEQPKIEDLLATLPKEKDVKVMLTHGHEDGETVTGVMTICLPELRKAAHDCPACIMAALRQRGIPIPCATGFNFTSEMNDIWTEINNARAEADEWHNCNPSLSELV